MKTLKEIFAETGNFSKQDIGCNDKGGLHTYIETYDKLFAPFQSGCNIMEIGLALGHSIRMFDEYFTNSNIVGVDISLVFDYVGKNNKVELIQADATKANFIKELNDEVKFDIIIDDGSHMTNDQIATFELLKGRMNKGGIYIIEDILALDTERKRYESLHNNIEIVDMRHTGRFDNVLLIYRF